MYRFVLIKFRTTFEAAWPYSVPDQLSSTQAEDTGGKRREVQTMPLHMQLLAKLLT